METDDATNPATGAGNNLCPGFRHRFFLRKAGKPRIPIGQHIDPNPYLP